VFIHLVIINVTPTATVDEYNRNATVYILQLQCVYSHYYRVSAGAAISAHANNIATSLPHLRRRKLAFVYVGDILATGQLIHFTT